MMKATRRSDSVVCGHATIHLAIRGGGHAANGALSYPSKQADDGHFERGVNYMDGIMSTILSFNLDLGYQYQYPNLILNIGLGL